MGLPSAWRENPVTPGCAPFREREDAPIGAMAFAVGFNSPSYFSRSFREEFGTSPSRYREGEGRT